MKYLKRLIIAFAVFMALMMVIFFVVINSVGDEERDIIDYNLTVHMIQNELVKGVPEATIEENYDCIIIYSTALDNEELAQCFKRGDMVMDLAIDGEYAGKVAFPDDYNKIKTAKERIAMLYIILWGVIALGGCFIFAAIYVLYLKPMNELVKFSSTIASGNLDEPLPISRFFLFENFVAAFDLMREQLKDAKTREMEAEKARKELVTDLSHDIKTPVSVIKAACEMLELRYQRRLNEVKKEEPESKEETELEDTLTKITVISDKAETINSLMSNVMHYTLEEINELKVSAKEEDTKEVTKIFEGLFGNEKIILDNEIKPCIIMMDKLRLEQAIENVVGNSFKYAKTDIHVDFAEAEAGPGAGMASASGKGTSGKNKKDGDKKEYIRIRIRDNGPGVKEDELPLLCEKYYRGSNSEDKNGYGLGLYLVKWYMEHMGGGMEYYNDNGFVVELFLRKA